LINSKLRITPEAEQDIFSIVASLQQNSNSAIVRKTLGEIKKQFQLLAEFPEAGRADGFDGTREVVMTGLPYITVYEQNNDLITIVRVLRGVNEYSPVVDR
jgi:toxin ParE1/3/4